MLAFFGEKSAELTTKKIISGKSNISIAETCNIGSTFYISNFSITDLPQGVNASASINVITYETVAGDSAGQYDFIYQFLLWDGSDGQIWFRSTYQGRKELAKKTWKKVNLS